MNCPVRAGSMAQRLALGARFFSWSGASSVALRPPTAGRHKADAEHRASLAAGAKVRVAALPRPLERRFPQLLFFLFRLGYIMLAQASPTSGQSPGFGRIAQDAIVPHPPEAFGPDVQTKAPQELLAPERHFLAPAFCPVVFVCEADVGVRRRQDPVVGDSRSVRVAPQVFDHLLGAAERPLGIHHPGLLVQAVAPGAVSRRALELHFARGQHQQACFERPAHLFHKDGPEHF